MLHKLSHIKKKIYPLNFPYFTFHNSNMTCFLFLLFDTLLSINIYVPYLKTALCGLLSGWLELVLSGWFFLSNLDKSIIIMLTIMLAVIIIIIIIIIITIIIIIIILIRILLMQWYHAEDFDRLQVSVTKGGFELRVNAVRPKRKILLFPEMRVTRKSLPGRPQFFV